MSKKITLSVDECLEKMELKNQRRGRRGVDVMTGEAIIQKLISRIELRYESAKKVETVFGEKASRPVWEGYGALLDFTMEIGCADLWHKRMKELRIRYEGKNNFNSR